MAVPVSGRNGVVDDGGRWAIVATPTIDGIKRFWEESALLRVLPHEAGDIHVLDRVLPTFFVERLSAVLARLEYSLSDYDDEQTREVLHLKCELPVQVLLSGLPLVAAGRSAGDERKAEYYLSGLALLCDAVLREHYDRGQATLRCRRIHANCVPFGDWGSNHVDSDFAESVTALYFGNARWLPRWGGELILCDQSGEAWYAVDGKPGRLVFFPSRVLHRFSSPSRSSEGHRFTVAHKFAATGSSEGH